MPYSEASLASVQAAVAQQLADPTNICWTAAEVRRYVIEALRTWQAITQGYRRRVEFTSVLSTAFYDLRTISPSCAEACSQTVTDTDLVVAIQDNLIEPATGTSWTGTDQFTLAAVTNALQARRDQFLSETGLVATHSVIDVPSQPIGRIPLPDATLDVRRAAWLPSSGGAVALNREDEWGLDSFAVRQWPNRVGTPKSYSVAVTPMPSCQIVPPPLEKGQLDLVLIQSGTTLDPTTGVLLGVPDDWTWAIRLGALADLLGRDGLASDPMRASYCAQRWADAIETAKKATSVLMAEVDGIPVRVVSVTEADRFKTWWQSTATTPTTIAMAGQTLVALVPMADDGPSGPTDTGYGITLDLVAKFPFAAADETVLQLAPDAVDAVTVYAQHLAMFKLGATAFASTQPILELFYRAAGLTDARDRAVAAFQIPIENRGHVDETWRPRLEAAEVS